MDGTLDASLNVLVIDQECVYHIFRLEPIPKLSDKNITLSNLFNLILFLIMSGNSEEKNCNIDLKQN